MIRAISEDAFLGCKVLALLFYPYIKRHNHPRVCTTLVIGLSLFHHRYNTGIGVKIFSQLINVQHLPAGP